MEEESDSLFVKKSIKKLNRNYSSNMFSEKLALTKPTCFSTFENLKQTLQRTLKPGDTVICLGAGSISSLTKELTKGEN